MNQTLRNTNLRSDEMLLGVAFQGLQQIQRLYRLLLRCLNQDRSARSHGLAAMVSSKSRTRSHIPLCLLLVTENWGADVLHRSWRNVASMWRLELYFLSDGGSQEYRLAIHNHPLLPTSSVLIGVISVPISSIVCEDITDAGHPHPVERVSNTACKYSMLTG